MQNTEIIKTFLKTLDNSGHDSLNLGKIAETIK